MNIALNVFRYMISRNLSDMPRYYKFLLMGRLIDVLHWNIPPNKIISVGSIPILKFYDGFGRISVF